MGKRSNKETIPDVDITLTAQELKKLFNEPAELMKLYIFLNMRRDFNNNIAGKVTRINDAAFKEAMDYQSIAGRKGWKPTTTHITRWLKQLENKGLIKPLGNYVFELPFACKRPPAKNQSHQAVTTAVTTGVTTLESDKTPLNTDGNPVIENEVSPDVSLEVAQRLYTPPNTLHNITLPSKDEFLKLLSQQGYYLNQLHDNKDTLAMVQVWIDAEVTLEEAQIGIKHANASRPPKPNTPYYYLKPVLQVRKDFEKARQQAQEIQTHVRQATTQANTSRYPKSATKQFWENAEKIFTGGNDDDD